MGEVFLGIKDRELTQETTQEQLDPKQGPTANNLHLIRVEYRIGYLPRNWRRGRGKESILGVAKDGVLIILKSFHGKKKDTSSQNLQEALSEDWELKVEPEKVVAVKKNNEDQLQVLNKWRDLLDFEKSWRWLPILSRFSLPSTLGTRCFLDEVLLRPRQ